MHLVSNIFYFKHFQIEKSVKPVKEDPLEKELSLYLSLKPSAIKIEIAYCFHSYRYCNCDWIVNRTAIANEIEVAYSFHSYRYCYCDWIVNSTATTIKTEIVFSRHYNRYCSCNWTLYVAAVAIETDIEFPIFQQLKLKLILNSVLWGYCYCGRSRTTLKKMTEIVPSAKKRYCAALL